MKASCIAQGKQLIALRSTKWEGNPRKRGYVCIADSLCCMVETNTAKESSYTPINVFCS